MCGIFGKLAFEGHAPYTTDFLQKTGERIRHRGPDDDGYFIDGPLSMGMRRLSIIDIRGGQQPISDESGAITVVFNGEIYNFREIRDRLIAKGRRLRTNSDTEVLVHLYAEKGVEMLQELVGMFAFAIWDKPNQTLFLARDRLGKKPMHYAITPHGLVFGSEIKSILLDPAVSREIDPQAVDLYFSMNFVPPPHTIFRAIRKLSPAHYLIATPSYVREPVLYWSLHRTPKFSISPEEAVEELRNKIEDAVRCRLVSDVPLGLLLSGGLDSSVIATVMAKCAGAKIKTFSVGFEGSMDNDDMFHARAIADRLGTEHHPLRLSPRLGSCVEKLAAHFDEPFADSSAVPTFLIAREARQYVTVALNGDGGDEAFAGYPRYRHSYPFARAWGTAPTAVRHAVNAALCRPLANSVIRDSFIRRKLRKWLLPDHRAIFQPEAFGPEDKQKLYRPDFLSALDPTRWDLYSGMLEESRRNSDNPAESLLDADVRLFLPGDLLVKMDMATMANSLEARSPFLDHRLIEYTAQLPWNLKIRGEIQKWILRKAYETQLPPEILARPKKGFSLPLRLWIRQELREMVSDVLLGAPDGLAQFLNREAVQSTVCEALNAKKGVEKQIWSLLIFELWRRNLSELPQS